MPRIFSLSALNERFAIAIAVGLRSMISAHQRSISAPCRAARHLAAGQPHGERLVRPDDAAGDQHVECPSLADEARQAHAASEVAAALGERQEELLVEPPTILEHEVLAQKLPVGSV